MSDVLKYSIISILGVMIAAFSQTLLKKEAVQVHKSKLAEYINVRVIAAYILFLVSSMASMLALRYIPLSLSSILASSSYIFVTVLSYALLKERLTKRQILGMIFIISGIIIFSL